MKAMVLSMPSGLGLASDAVDVGGEDETHTDTGADGKGEAVAEEGDVTKVPSVVLGLPALSVHAVVVLTGSRIREISGARSPRRDVERRAGR